MHNTEDDITPKLVTLYSESLAAALDTPDVFVNTLVRKLKEMVRIHGLVMILEPEQGEEGSGERVGNVARIHVPGVRKPHVPPSIQVDPLRIEPGKNVLDGLMEQGMRDLRQAASVRYPGHIRLHTYWFRTEHIPRIATCIFRAQMPDDTEEDFTPEERSTLGTLEGHIGLCMRVHAEVTRAGRSSFDFFTGICREISAEHGLTLTESRVLRKIVEGSPNKEIGTELQISLATVKTHISHILQKTGCRNRTDLIGKYFSSKKAIMR